jgi:hypothetical protein
LLQYYAIERFLYRLSATPHRARFVLNGAWSARSAPPPSNPTARCSTRPS